MIQSFDLISPLFVEYEQWEHHQKLFKNFLQGSISEHSSGNWSHVWTHFNQKQPLPTHWPWDRSRQKLLVDRQDIALESVAFQLFQLSNEFPELVYIYPGYTRSKHAPG